MNWLDRLQKIDRRWIFLLLALAVILPLIRPIGLKIAPTVESEGYYNVIDSLPEGSVILVSFDFGPSAAAEILPAAEALIRHAFRKNLKVISIALWPDGEPFSQRVLDEAAAEFNKKYGEDYATFGYKAGLYSVMSQIGEGFDKAFPEDTKGTPTASVPLTSRVGNYHDISLTAILAAGSGFEWWIGIANGRYKERLVGTVTAVMASDAYPYLQTKQIEGLLGGLKPSAEYRQLVMKKPDPNMVKMLDAQSLSHLVIILFIIVGNLGYIASSKGKRRVAPVVKGGK